MEIRQYPFYFKATVILFGIVLLVYVLFNLQDIIIPLAFAMVLAILLNPVFNWLQLRHIPKIPSIIMTILLALIVFGGIMFFLSSQIVKFSDLLPELKEKMGALNTQFVEWTQAHLGISVQKQVTLINEALNNSKGLVGSTLSTAVGTLGIILLLPVYIFLFLFYKPLILNFLFEVFAEENSKQVGDIVNETKTAVQSYMVGLLLEALIVAILNSTALLILGVKYAVLIGVIGAILNVIPYIGGIIAIALPVLIATVTKDGYSTQLGIIAAYLIIQFIDNNILVPRIVSSKVQINALVSIITVLLGAALWGVPGMFLSIPFVGILKIIFDRIPDLKPWGKLLGDTVPARHKGELWNSGRKKTTPK
ncbi:MAG TPA: AI-2E family transporter [Bacteroidia bacterium]|nr:AI-2E family transporter [Chitinophagaceae bacterium]HLP32234.1 AI-2E family transporter [Bacteroidia bacterium]